LEQEASDILLSYKREFQPSFKYSAAKFQRRKNKLQDRLTVITPVAHLPTGDYISILVARITSDKFY